MHAFVSVRYTHGVSLHREDDDGDGDCDVPGLRVPVVSLSLSFSLARSVYPCLSHWSVAALRGVPLKKDKRRKFPSTLLPSQTLT